MTSGKRAKQMRPWLQIGALTLGSRCSDGSLTLAAYHPRKSPTWYWSVGITHRQPHLRRIYTRTPAAFRRGQWHDYLKLPGGLALSISRQDYHRRDMSRVTHS